MVVEGRCPGCTGNSSGPFLGDLSFGEFVLSWDCVTVETQSEVALSLANARLLRGFASADHRQATILRQTLFTVRRQSRPLLLSILRNMSYDVIVIGAGPVGENVADRAARGGMKVAIVEKELVGGECSYWACVPSKALLRSGAAMRAAQHVDGAAQAVTSSLDAGAVLKRRNYMVSNWSDKGQVDWLASAGVELLRGRGRITGVKKVKVDEREYTANHAVVVATGSDPFIPTDIKGVKEVNAWTSREATGSQKIPPSLLIIGGGVVACEMATAWCALGSKVTLTSRGRLLEGVEPFGGEMVAKSLGELGVDVRLGIAAVSVERKGDVIAKFNDGSTITASELLIATGRIPRTHDIGLETIGLKPGAWLPVDETLLVKHSTNDPDPWLYATGDVNHRALLTHQGKYQGRAVGDTIADRAHGKKLSTEPWGWHVATADLQSVPQVIFTDPEVTAVGLNEAQAKKKGFKVKCVEYEIGSVSGAYLHADGYKGRAKAVVDEETEVLLGVTFVGPDVSELLHSATIAVVGQVPIKRLWHAVPSFPTMSEIWLRLLETYGRENRS